MNAKASLKAKFTSPNSELVHVRGELITGKNVSIDINVIFEGIVELGDNVSIGPNCIIHDSSIHANCQIKENTTIDSATIEHSATIGPFARIRPNTTIGPHTQIGNFVEIKASTLGEHCKVNHHSFVGDATIGNHVILGASFITCNHDGSNSTVSIIEDHVYIGSAVQIIAPIKIAKHAFIGAGSTITEDVPEKVLAIARSKQTIIKRNKLKP